MLHLAEPRPAGKRHYFAWLEEADPRHAAGARTLSSTLNPKAYLRIQHVDRAQE
jgi:hypothetical protein